MPSKRVPVLRIVHYSDMHIAGVGYASQYARMMAMSRRLPHYLRQKARQGFGIADTSALLEFIDFLADIAADADWQGLPLWLVDTGDGTAFGDTSSLDDWKNNWSVQFRNAAGPNARQCVLYGNHDAWPGVYPLLSPHRMQAQRNQLRGAPWFTETWPTSPLVASVNGQSEIQLYALNSVDHRLMAGIKATGKVLPDRFWESPAPPVGPTACGGLRRAIAQAAPAVFAPHFRILAMHYPVCDAATGKGPYELLVNRRSFSDETKPLPGHTEPAIHLLLAGHTHSGYPALGLLPAGANSVAHAPLELGQVQLVTPSLSQVNTLPAPPVGTAHAEQTLHDFPHQCTLLQFYASLGAPLEITIERLVAGRAVGGAFGYLPLVPGSQRITEEMSFVL